MNEREIAELVGTAPQLSHAHGLHVVERAANQLITMAHRLTDSELEDMIALVALCYQKADAESCT